MKTRQDLNDDIRNRQKYNICILKLVADMVKKYPDLRFHLTKFSRYWKLKNQAMRISSMRRVK